MISGVKCVVSEREMCLKVPLARQFALTAVNFKCSAAEQVLSGTLLEHVFFVSCPRLDVTDGNV